MHFGPMFADGKNNGFFGETVGVLPYTRTHGKLAGKVALQQRPVRFHGGQAGEGVAAITSPRTKRTILAMRDWPETAPRDGRGNGLDRAAKRIH